MSVADKLHQRQMALRKKSGLPHPDYYKELGHSYNISDDKERLAKQTEIKKKYKVEETEQLDEMPESSMKTRDVHAHLKKAGWSLKRTGGGHDVYAHPKSKEHIAVPRHKQLKAPLIRGIMKASRVSEEAEIEEQLYKKGRFVSEPAKKPFKSATIVSPVKEAKDANEYDYEGDMTKGQLRTIIRNAQKMHDMLDDDENLPEWVQSKITLSKDYIVNAANYLESEMNEETELSEGRPSQRHPLEGHEYHKKSNAELIGIAKDAHAAAEAMKGHSPQSENKYRDQANDSATVRYFRQKSGMPDWYKKKYGHVKEEIEQLEEKNVPTSPEKWAQAKAQAKAKFDVYPSAYANGWAAKKYKEMGGGWKSVSESVNEAADDNAKSVLSRKAQIVRDAARKKESPEKFQKDPELSSDIHKT